MKKVLRSLYALFLLLSLAACGQEPTPKSALTVFSAEFSGVYRSLSVGGRLTAGRAGLMELSFTSPDTLEGLTIGKRGGAVLLGRGSLLCTADEGYLPQDSLPELIGGCLREASSALPDENGEIVARLGGGEYIVRVGEDGIISSLEGEGLKITFREVKTE